MHNEPGTLGRPKGPGGSPFCLFGNPALCPALTGGVAFLFALVQHHSNWTRTFDYNFGTICWGFYQRCKRRCHTKFNNAPCFNVTSFLFPAILFNNRVFLYMTVTEQDWGWMLIVSCSTPHLSSLCIGTSFESVGALLELTVAFVKTLYRPRHSQWGT